MSHARRNSFKFKFLKTVEDDPSQCSSSIEDDRKKRSSKAYADQTPVGNGPWTEGDTKRSRISQSTEELEDLNDLIENRQKKTASPESQSIGNSQSNLSEEQSRHESNSERKKKGGSAALLTKKASDLAEVAKTPELTQTDSSGSEFSFEKVLGMCRRRLQTMGDHRQKLLNSMQLTKWDAEESNGKKESRKPEEKGGKGESGHRRGKNTKKQQPKSEAQQEQVTRNSSKSQINEILKGHAQKVSSDSLSSCYKMRDYNASFEETAELLRKAQGGGRCASTASRQSAKISKKDNGEKAKTTTVAVKKEVKEEEFDEEMCYKEKGDVMTLKEENKSKNKEEEKPKVESVEPKNLEEIPKAEEAQEMSAKETKPERKDEFNRRVSYTDRLLLNRFSKDEETVGKTQGMVVASVLEKLNTPFTSGMVSWGRPGSADVVGGNLLQGLPIQPMPKSAPGSTPSEAALLSSMLDSIMKNNTTKVDTVRPAKEPRIKLSDSAIKNKCPRSNELKELVTQAIKEHKIFCVFDNHWYIVRPVREELLNRGWVEVIPDRRLIPRRKPPPAGPTVERLTSTDYAIEAILTAKEAFADDVTDIVARYPPTKFNPDRAKPSRKTSDESVKEAISEFRIVPPSADRKKNNSDIRDFVSKVHRETQRTQSKAVEKEKSKERKWKKATQAIEEREMKDGLTALYQTQVLVNSPSNPPLSKSVLAILDTINTNRRIISGLTNVGIAEGEKVFVTIPQSHVQSQQQQQQQQSSTSQDQDVNKGSRIALTENEAKVVSKMIQSSNARIHFMWLSIKPAIHLKCFNYSPEIINKFQKTTFCTKIGLWSHLNNIQWYAHEVHFPAKSPRMYNTGEADDLQAFFQDFHITACIGMLKWLSETFFDKGIKGVQKKKGKVPIKAFEFAIRQCERYMRFRENEDLNCLEEPKVLQEEWNTFLQWFYIITNDHGKVQETSNAQLMVVYTKAVEVLRAMKRHWPEIDIDGRLNIWIMKPYCASCGRGIFMTNNVYYISQHSKYIVQKYIERPLLIYNTKFDIRQWFMITKLIPLEIWMYKECYLRFCTQPFALRNLHESVHLSNNSVQRKYVRQIDPSQGDQNMWDSNTFQHYLKTIGQPNAWNDIIYPGMRDAIISIMLAAQDTFDSQRRSWFEVYGADFMISANIKDGPWLIEINENPAMDPSTKVTSRLCPQMLRDVIKVVVDRKVNKNALTGQWELVYRQNYSPSFGTIDIDVKGKRIARIAQKSGYAGASSSSPQFVTSNSKKDEEKQYEIVKSYNPKKTNMANDVDADWSKHSIWKSRGKGRLSESTTLVDKHQKSGRG